MPVTTSAFTSADFQVKYRDPYITKSTNEKMAVTVPRGIYRGFRLGPGSSNYELFIRPDAPAATGNTGYVDSFDDHVAVYQVGAGDDTARQFSLTIRKTGGTFSMDLSSIAGVSPVTAYIVLYANYAYGSTTSAEMRAYTAAEWAALTTALKSELIVLGQCTIPATGSPAAVTAVNHDGRTSAWAETAPEAVDWSPVLKNPGFDYSVSGSTGTYGILHWVNHNDLAVNGGFRSGSSTILNGPYSLEFNKSAVGAGVGKIEQHVEVPVVAHQVVRVLASVRQLIAPTAGTYTINFYWGDSTSAALSSTAYTFSVTSTTDASWRTVDAGVMVPGTAKTLKSVTIEVAGLTTASTGVALVVDNFQVYVEAGSPWNTAAAINARLRQEVVSALILEDQTSYSLGQLAALLRMDRTTPASEGRVVVERKDQDYTSGNLPPALALFGRLLDFGSKAVSTQANALKPRAAGPYRASVGDYTLLEEWTRDGESAGGYTQPPMRVYTNNSGDFMVTINAKYSGTNWARDMAVQSAALVVARGGVSVLHYPAGSASPWTTWKYIVQTSDTKVTLGESGFTIDLDLVDGNIVRTDRKIVQMAFGNSPTSAYTITPGDTYTFDLAASATVYIPIVGLRVGERLKKVAFVGVESGGVPTYSIVSENATQASTKTYTGFGGLEVNLTLNTPYEIVAAGVTSTSLPMIKIVNGGGVTLQIAHTIQVTVDQLT